MIATTFYSFVCPNMNPLVDIRITYFVYVDEFEIDAAINYHTNNFIKEYYESFNEYEEENKKKIKNTESINIEKYDETIEELLRLEREVKQLKRIKENLEYEKEKMEQKMKYVDKIINSEITDKRHNVKTLNFDIDDYIIQWTIIEHSCKVSNKKVIYVSMELLNKIDPCIIIMPLFVEKLKVHVEKYKADLEKHISKLNNEYLMQQTSNSYLDILEEYY